MTTLVNVKRVGDPTPTERHRLDNDFLVVCDGDIYISSIVAYANGTHVITLKKEPA